MSYGPQVKELRRQGHAVKEIAKMLGCAFSTASYHCKNVKVEDTERLKRHIQEVNKKNSKIGSNANAEIWKHKREKAQNEAIEEWEWVKKDPELMGFIGLYWGEGSKTNRDVNIVNNDPGVIAASLKQLKRLSNNRIGAHVYYYPNHDPRICSKYWGDLLKINILTSPKAWLGKKRKTSSKFGLCRIRVGDYKLYQKIMTWIKLWREEAIRAVA